MIQIKDLYKIFGKHPAQAKKLLSQGVSKEEILNKTGQAVGVQDTSFNVYEGETLVVMGLSGSGKSTLIRMLNRLIEPTYGTVIVDGTDVTTLDDDELRMFRRKQFGMVFQSFALFPHRTVLENVEFGLEIQEVDEETRRNKAQESLELVGLGGWGDYLPEKLSGGMKQRVGLARALTVDPAILLMDEAFSALDPLIRSDMQDELLKLESQVQKTIVFITHDLDEALKMGDRIVLMKDGKVVQIGTPDEILTDPATRYVEKFVENVDITKVLSAEDVMLKHQHVVTLKDGPRTALHVIKEFGLAGVMVVKQNRELVGYLSAEAAVQGVKNEDAWIDHICTQEVPTVPPDEPLKQIFPMVADSRDPIAVVDEKRNLKGVIYRGSVLAALAEQGEQMYDE